MEYNLLRNTDKTIWYMFSIFSVICVRPFKLSINSTVTKTGWFCYQYVSKLSFASVRMCDCKRLSAHNFVDFCLLSSDDLNHQWGVAMSITATMSVVQSHTPDVTQTSCHTVAIHHHWGGSLCGRRPPLLSKARTDLFLVSYTDWNDLLVDSQSLCSYSVEQITVLHKY